MIDFGIIAAGDGERIKKEGSPVSKPLVEIGGVPMIGRLVELMEAAEANSISIVVNKEMPEVVEYLEKLAITIECPLKTILRKTESSFHSFKELLTLIDSRDKFIVTTVDTVFSGDKFMKFVEYFRRIPDSVDGLMGVSHFIDDEKPLYVGVNETGKINSFKDIPDGAKNYVSAGVYGLRSGTIEILETCYEKGISRMRNFQRELLEAGLCLNAFDMGKVIDVDHLSDVEEADRFLKDNKTIISN